MDDAGQAVTTETAQRDNPSCLEDTWYDPWHWLLDCGDNLPAVDEYDANGKHRNFELLRRNLPVRVLVLLPAYPALYPGLKPVVVEIPPGALPVVRRKRSVVAVISPDMPKEPAPRETVVGWQKRGGHKNLIRLFDDGSIII